MPHKTAALMRFSSGSQAAEAPTWAGGTGPALRVLDPLSGGNHRHIILLSSWPGHRSHQKRNRSWLKNPFSAFRFPLPASLLLPDPTRIPFCGWPHAAGYWPSRGFE